MPYCIPNDIIVHLYTGCTHRPTADKPRVANDGGGGVVPWRHHGRGLHPSIQTRVVVEAVGVVASVVPAAHLWHPVDQVSEEAPDLQRVVRNNGAGRSVIIREVEDVHGVDIRDVAAVAGNHQHFCQLLKTKKNSHMQNNFASLSYAHLLDLHRRPLLRLCHQTPCMASVRSGRSRQSKRCLQTRWWDRSEHQDIKIYYLLALLARFAGRGF